MTQGSVDSVQELADWLAALGRVEDSDSQIEIIGIKQRLAQMRDPRINHERWGRLFLECLRFRDAIKMRRHVLPLAVQGEKFKLGRKLGSVGPIRRAIRRHLKKDSTLDNGALWMMISDNPPRGWTFRDNQQGRYAEGPKAPRPQGGMSFARFRTIASEERRLLK